LRSLKTKEEVEMTKKLLSTGIGLLGVLLVMVVFTPSDAQAIPAFSRQNNVACSTCHTAWPLLNATGRSYKENGYRFSPGEDRGNILSDFLQLGESFPMSALIKSRPYDKKEGGDEKLRAIHEFELLVAGGIGKEFSTFVELEAEDELNFVPGMKGWVTWHPSEMFNLQVAYDSAFVADPFDTLSGSRRLTRNRNAVIDQSFGGAGGKLRSTRQVLSIYGRPMENIFYNIGWSGNAGDAEGVNASNLHARLAVSLLDYVTIGGFGIWGQCEATDPNCDINRDFNRYGVDMQVEYENAVIHTAWLTATDDNNALDPVTGLLGDVTNNAFYVSGLYVFEQEGRPWIVPSARLDIFEKANGANRFTELTLNLGYYVTENVRVYTEWYKQLDVPTGLDTGGRFTVQVELAF
jgi:hypothetical protein